MVGVGKITRKNLLYVKKKNTIVFFFFVFAIITFVLKEKGLYAKKLFNKRG